MSAVRRTPKRGGTTPARPPEVAPVGAVAPATLHPTIAVRYGARVIGAISLCGFSIMTLLTGTASNFATLFITRLGLGVFEAPTFPLNSALARLAAPVSPALLLPIQQKA